MTSLANRKHDLHKYYQMRWRRIVKDLLWDFHLLIQYFIWAFNKVVGIYPFSIYLALVSILWQCKSNQIYKFQDILKIWIFHVNFDRIVIKICSPCYKSVVQVSKSFVLNCGGHSRRSLSLGVLLPTYSWLS